VLAWIQWDFRGFPLKVAPSFKNFPPFSSKILATNQKSEPKSQTSD
jgi:hypothetical protein